MGQAWTFFASARLPIAFATTILLTTLGFGLWPFNFLSPNDVLHSTEAGGLRFNGAQRFNDSDRRGLAYSGDAIVFRQGEPLAVYLALLPEGYPKGLGTLLELSDGKTQPPLIVAQWQQHLVIRSRRSETERNRPYREIGYRQCLLPNRPLELLVSSDGLSTRIYIDGELVETKSGFGLLDPDKPTEARIVIGASADGDQSWIGAFKALRIYRQSIAPADLANDGIRATVAYDFGKLPAVGRIANQNGTAFELVVPRYVNPLQRKRFSLISSFDPNNKALVRDVVVNLFGFAPLGFAICLVARRRSGSARIAAFATAAAFCALITLGIESAQILLPGRNPSHLDLIANTIGGALGASIALILAPARFRTIRIAK